MRLLLKFEPGQEKSFMEKSMLIVEDEAIIASSLKVCFKELGYNVFNTVSRGEDAIESSAKNNPDIILMDIGLRGAMDGYETVRAIRRSSNAPVIYMTGGNQFQIDEKAKDTKPYDYMTKPFDVEALADKIKKLLQERGGQRKPEKAERGRDV